MTYDDAVLELHQAPHAAFVGERKRLAGALKAAGDKEGAARLAKLPRPPVSAWAVNQLWWHARDVFDAMLAAGERLRAGDLGAGAAHREAIGKLRQRAAAILSDAGHGGSEAVLRRVATTLAAIAAAGGFAPDLPGALGDDRDPPGFEAMGILGAAAGGAAAPASPVPVSAVDVLTPSERVAVAQAAAPEVAAPAAREVPRLRLVKPDPADEARRLEAEAARARAAAAAAAEQRRLEQEAARKQAERERLAAALRTATGEVERIQRDIARLRGAVTEAEGALERAVAIARDLAERLAALA